MVISRRANWPAMGDRSLAGYQQKRVWLNDGAGRFLDVAPDGRRHRSLRRPRGRARRSVEPRRARRDRRQPARPAAALPQRGGARPRLDRLRARRRLPAGQRPRHRARNRSAIGARVTVFWNGQQQVQEVSGGSGFCAQNQRRLHFGLGRRRDGRQGGRALAVGQDAGAAAARRSNRVHKVEEPA